MTWLTLLERGTLKSCGGEITQTSGNADWRTAVGGGHVRWLGWMHCESS